jgi:hypothetical protein
VERGEGSVASPRPDNDLMIVARGAAKNIDPNVRIFID